MPADKPTPERLPRLGDRADLRLEILLAAVSTYRQSRRESTGGRIDLSEDEAREELEDVLRESYVTYSSGDTMRVRARVSRLDVDAESELIRVSPTLLRCIFSRARRLNAGGRKTGRGGADNDFRVMGEDGKRIGFLRSTPRGIEWRPIAPSSGAPAEPWRMGTGDLLPRVGVRFRPALRAWLDKNGAAHLVEGWAEGES